MSAGKEVILARSTLCDCVVIFASLLCATASNDAQQPLMPTPAVSVDPKNAILDAFRSYSIVALSEGTHGNEQSLSFQLSLIRDSRFADRVNDIVLEGPNARYQDVMNRYVRGEDVTAELLRRVWDVQTQQQAGGPMWTGEVPELYRAVRQLNASLSAEQKLRILLGDPPIDWGQVRTKEDHAKWIALRDT